MNVADVNDALNDAARLIKGLGRKPKRHPANDPVPTPFDVVAGSGYYAQLDHALWMCHEAVAMPAILIEEKHRYLGFVQGVMWMSGLHSVKAVAE